MAQTQTSTARPTRSSLARAAAPKAAAKGKTVKAKPAPAPAPAADTSKRKARPAPTEESAKAKPAKRTVKARSIEEIVKDAPLAKTDWRAKHHGKTAKIRGFQFAGETIELENSKTRYPVLLALPRDSDVGGQGARFRTTGHIAVHSGLGEDGKSYVGQPHYLLEKELLQLL